MKSVAILCASPRSVYHSMQDVIVYDRNRDAKTFTGGMPVVAHPPCRAWSAYCAHQAKPEPGEKELGPLCVDWLKECGGVLEHPAHSRLFAFCGLPKPGRVKTQEVWSAEVCGSWWGDSRTKTTWLCFFHIWPFGVRLPLALHDPTGDRRKWQLMGRAQRSATTRSMAIWLVDVARKSTQHNQR